MSQITLSVVACMVDRGRNLLRVEVPEHEAAVLRAVHGPESVQIIERDVDELELEISAEAEWDRLVRTYARTGAADPVRYTWPDGPSSLERYGFKTGMGLVDHESDLRIINPKRRGRPPKNQLAAASV